ncbi:molybdate transporter periplasmic protein [Clavibacter michiganensis subsp. michiganensis]|uniref:Molybdate transporter periplasmic protein n=1 Tax=Clavibacter michiganensis subsp. michiganensis TaxID=33013 RepID=A0A251XJG7_CLAMM|nr:molybdate transporter periplasmic protein [Clavibacter michiganensis subsp. michiganensis]OUE03652.1 molybdate transporter periplasmic protein [Clavibacter michiganensis subsp. michiganensis]
MTVTVSYGGSSTLAQQIVQGAPADVFASASDATMTTVVDAGETAADPRVFARNALEIAVPPGNPGRVAGLADFADPPARSPLRARGAVRGRGAQAFAAQASPRSRTRSSRTCAPPSPASSSARWTRPSSTRRTCAPRATRPRACRCRTR